MLTCCSRHTRTLPKYLCLAIRRAAKIGQLDQLIFYLEKNDIEPAMIYYLAKEYHDAPYMKKTMDFYFKQAKSAFVFNQFVNVIIIANKMEPILYIFDKQLIMSVDHITDIVIIRTLLDRGAKLGLNTLKWAMEEYENDEITAENLLYILPCNSEWNNKLFETQFNYFSTVWPICCQLKVIRLLLSSSIDNSRKDLVVNITVNKLLIRDLQINEARKRYPVDFVTPNYDNELKDACEVLCQWDNFFCTNYPIRLAVIPSLYNILLVYRNYDLAKRIWEENNSNYLCWPPEEVMEDIYQLMFL